MNERKAPPPIIGESAAIRRARGLIERYAPTRLPILLQGATGTGKDLFSQHVHYLSGRPGDTVDINCGALPREMVESLLFGHRRGAFTGAVESMSGQIERADGKTLFLDELVHLPTESQVKLLRVLETGDVQRLGEGTKRRVDVRVVAAVQDDLLERLENGMFRRDLFQRLAGVVIHLPALAERPEDVLVLATHFAELQGRPLEPGCQHVIENYSWPGNVRELRLAIERSGYLVENGTLTPSALVEAIELGVPRIGLDARVDHRNVTAAKAREELVTLCETNACDVRLIASSLGIGRSALFQRLKIFGISLRALRQSGKVRGRTPDFPN